jgi:hypothetical protein
MICILVVLACMALVYFNYRHNHRFSFNEDKLRAAIVKAFDQAQADKMSRTDFLLRLKKIYSCSHKEATFLLGAAKEGGLVNEINKEIVKGKEETEA